MLSRMHLLLTFSAAAAFLGFPGASAAAAGFGVFLILIVFENCWAGDDGG